MTVYDTVVDAVGQNVGSAIRRAKGYRATFGKPDRFIDSDQQKTPQVVVRHLRQTRRLEGHHLRGANMSTLGNSVALLLATISSSIVVLTQLMVQGGRLRFRWEKNFLEIYVDKDSNGGTQ